MITLRYAALAKRRSWRRNSIDFVSDACYTIYYSRNKIHVDLEKVQTADILAVLISHLNTVSLRSVITT